MTIHIPHNRAFFIFQPKQTKIPYDYFFVTPVFGFIQNSRSQALFIFNFWGGGPYLASVKSTFKTRALLFGATPERTKTPNVYFQVLFT
jgi:hypothetical protein